MSALVNPLWNDIGKNLPIPLVEVRTTLTVLFWAVHFDVSIEVATSATPFEEDFELAHLIEDRRILR